MTRHKHTPDETMEHNYRGPVGDPQDPVSAAHGGYAVRETCSCGAERTTNHNNGREEVGYWLSPPMPRYPTRDQVARLERTSSDPDILRLCALSRLDHETLRERLRRASTSAAEEVQVSNMTREELLRSAQVAAGLETRPAQSSLVGASLRRLGELTQ